MINFNKSLKYILYDFLKLPLKIPTSDDMAIKLYPEYEKYYNKVFLCKIQDIEYGFDVPSKFPVVTKPYINLKGGSLNFKIVKKKKDFKLKQGLFWMEYLQGLHLCIDIFILKGEIKLYTVLKSKAAEEGTFEYHESLPNFLLPKHLKDLIIQNFNTYTGIINCETIDNKIIDFHLRPNGDFFLYNSYVVREIINLYFNQKWELNNYKIPKMFLFPIFIKQSNNFEFSLDKIISILKFHNCDNLLFEYELKSPGGNRILMYSAPSYEQGNNAKIEILKNIKFYKIQSKFIILIFLLIAIFLINYNGTFNK
jgi:hypothetical protein